jgi:hypothetical protein
MRGRVQTQTQEVAGGRLASSAQPPRATPLPAQRTSPKLAPQPTTSTGVLDKPGALLEGLRCFPAFRPLSGSENTVAFKEGKKP